MKKKNVSNNQKKRSLQVGRSEPTIREVAKLARVAVMTVSRVINDNASVRGTTKKRVEAAISALGYQRNEAAGLLKGQRARIIGLIVPDLSDIFFATCAHTVEQYARQNGFMTHIISSGGNADLELDQAELMEQRKISGLLIATSGIGDPARVQRLQQSGFAVVAFDRPLSGVDTDVVLIENRLGAEDAVRHLIGHGHKRIACTGYDDATYPAKERVDGYLNTMRAAGLEPHVMMGMTGYEEVMEWIKRARVRRNLPTAIFSINYRTSVFLLRALSELKVRIPQDIAMIGFDDFELAPVLSSPLTTVGQSPVDLTKRAVRLLLDRIEDTHSRKDLSPAKILLPASLIVRRSCGCHAEK